MKLVIYGAQGIALGAYEALHNICPDREIICFLVTKREMNAEYLAGIPVLETEFFSKSLSDQQKQELEILIATPETAMPEIEEMLDQNGLYCHVRLTASRWAELMGYCYAIGRKYTPLHALPIGYHKANIHVYMAKFYKDKPLTGKYQLPEWVTPIQVGASLCKERVADILDCDGENISEKNVNYSELTALYWMWKNRLNTPSVKAQYEYYGLVHYRRVLEFTDDDVLRLADNGVDVVLPYPMPYEPDIEAHHNRYLKEEDWNAVQNAVSGLYPEYGDFFPHVLKQRYLYNYNIVLAKKNVLAEYCDWLFPILEQLEENSVPRGADRADRYVGYAGETLATLYFMYNRDKLNIAHTGCRFLI
nr:DUF4422 domain-containing protein [uncultured Acetatifactor sp.]